MDIERADLERAIELANHSPPVGSPAVGSPAARTPAGQQLATGQSLPPPRLPAPPVPLPHPAGFARGAVTIAAYAEYWRMLQLVRPTTQERFEYSLRNRIIPRFGARLLEEVTTIEVQAWVGELVAEGLAPGTIRTLTSALSTMLMNARREGLLDANPCELLRLPRVDTSASVVRPLSVTEVQALANEIGPRYRALVLIMAHQGLRLGEACGLTRDRVDLTSAWIVVDQQLVTPAVGSPRLGPPKTRSSFRRLPMASSAVRVMEQHLDAFPLGPNGLIFTSSRGRPLGRTTFGQLFRMTAQRLGIDATSHDLRHHCASLLIAAGCPVTTVQHFLGHKNATETLDTYSHLWNPDADRIRAAIDSQFGSSVA